LIFKILNSGIFGESQYYALENKDSTKLTSSISEALRYDLTVPLLVMWYNIRTILNFRLKYQIQPVWRDGPQKGRFRSFFNVMLM
jgi:histidyl-tRNA synthetase